MCAEQRDVDLTLRQVLGAPRPTSSERARILQRRVESQPATSHRERRLVLAGSLVLALALLVGVFVSTQMESSLVRSVSAAERALATPQPGTGRHLHIDVVTHLGARAVLPPVWSTDVWQRTLDDGTEQLMIASIAPDGTPLARLVSAGNQWELAANGSIDRGIGSPATIPIDISAGLVSPDQLRVQLAGHEPVRTEQHGSVLELTYRFPTDAIEGDVRDLGFLPQQLQIAIQVDSAHDRLITWRAQAVDERGTVHDLWELRFTVWDDNLPASAVSDEHFMISGDTDSPTRTTELDLPTTLSLSAGTLTRTTFQVEQHEAWKAIYSSPDYGVIQLDIIAASIPTDDLPVARTHTFAVVGVDVWWQEDPENVWPRLAIWEDGRYRYRLSVLQHAPEWDVRSLEEFVETLSTTA